VSEKPWNAYHGEAELSRVPTDSVVHVNQPGATQDDRSHGSYIRDWKSFTYLVELSEPAAMELYLKHCSWLVGLPQFVGFRPQSSVEFRARWNKMFRIVRQHDCTIIAIYKHDDQWRLYTADEDILQREWLRKATSASKPMPQRLPWPVLVTHL
jgi:hypothetical protein